MDDIAVGMMMVATALFQEAESPLGHCAFFGPMEAPGEQVPALAQGVADRRAGMVGALRAAWERFEAGEARRHMEAPEIYTRLRMVADKG